MYSPHEIEKKWQRFWQENATFKTSNDFTKPKYYCLDMFPYPSGAGLHVGHPLGYTANDIIARYKHANGFNVLHPMGWDAFGLPAENYAIKTGTHPKKTTEENIHVFKTQIQSLGFSYDWDREIDTTDPKYYQWTQWIFLKMFEAGLAYEQDLPINFCPSCKTGLANEEVLSNGCCDRCGTDVEKKKLRQWVLAITKYADRLEKDVDALDWPEGIKGMQKKWIGKSEGCEFKMERAEIEDKKNEVCISNGVGLNDLAKSSSASIIGKNMQKVKKELYQQHSSNQSSDHLSLSVYTTRIDTVFGMTYVVMAPDHSDVEGFITPEQKKACEDYIKESKSKSDVDRTATKEKTGVFTGSFVINPFNQEKIPVYIGDYVLGNYGTGAVMAVPAHDERDFEFAKKYNLKIVPTIFPAQYRDLTDKQEDENLSDEDYDTIRSQITAFEDDFCTREAFTDDGYLYNIKVEIGDNFEKDLENAEFMFFEFTGLSSEEAREKLTQYAQEKGFGTKKVNYKLRDWLFSRQRYWGEPIPLIHLDIEDLKKLPHISDLKEALDPKLAYILKRAPKDGECSCDATTCGGKVRELIIGGKVYSKLYDGLYTKIVIDYNLPLKLPEVQNYAPSPEGHSPLSNVPEFVNVRLADNLSGKRETNTMPQWGGSCWYYLRFMDNHNDQMLVDPEVEKYWGHVDSYVGGAEHAVLHLLYARFWHKFLFDIGVVSTSEPFQSLKNQGMILAYAYQTSVGGLIANDLVEERDGKFFHKTTQEPLTQVIAKMSKSLKNVVNPDVIVKQYGADTLRLFEMYMSDFKDSAPWDIKNIIGVYRFLEKATALFEKGKVAHDDKESIKLLHKTIKKVSEDIENYKFNTAIASLMILVNYGHPADESLAREWKGVFARLLHPFAPHLAEELWESLGEKKSIFFAPWVRYDPALCIDDTVVIGIQVLGKVRGELEIAIDESKDSVLGRAKEVESVKKWLEGQTIVKEVYIPGKIVNFVVKPI